MRTLLPLLALAGAACSSGSKTPDPGRPDVRLVVDTASGRRAISPLVYGINGATEAADRPSIVRVGGNRLTAYNWENNASNAGIDYCNQNDDTFGGPGSTPAAAFRAVLDDARARDTAAIVTLPIVDDVAADHDDLGDQGQGPPACVGDVQNSGAGYLASRFAKNHPRKGAAFVYPPSLADDAVYQDELVDYLHDTWGDVPIYLSLDNEPDLWASTHPRIRPDPLTYAELVQRNVDYATAAKDAWPGVPTLGFVSFGYSGYVSLQDAPDAAGNGEFLAYYLDRMEDAATTYGGRVIDLLDLHWYPEAKGGGVRISSVADGTAAAARVQAPRSLWDESYEETSWIVDDYLHAPIRLLPWLRETIDAHYPGTGLAITEWNYGGGDDVSGALATADALGVFGREGVTIATIWRLYGDEPFTRAGLRAFTNFDGSGGAFEETSVSATTDDVERVTVYASEGDDGRLVVVVINKDDASVTAGLRVATDRPLDHFERYQLDRDAPALTHEADLDVSAEGADAGPGVGFFLTLPARSVTVLAAD